MPLRRVLTAAGLALAAVLMVGQVRQLLADPSVWPPDDFVEYWAAAKLTLAGENPYDPALLLPLQQAAGRDTDEAIMMWNPPWSLAVVLPLGLLPAREAQLLWLALNLVVAGFCGDRLWLLLGGSPARRWVGWAVTLAFLPTLFALQSGQISLLLLLGAVLFLECERRGWPVLAGAATVLLAIKPHLAYLVWVAILADAVCRWRVGVIFGGVVAGSMAVLIALAFNPHLLNQYADALGNRPPAQWVSPTLGTLLRLAFGEERFRLQFVPMGIGLAWFAWHWMRTRHSWNWGEQLPLLLLVSFVTAPYGAWPFDMVLLLPAVLRMVAVCILSLSGGCQPPELLSRGADTPRSPGLNTKIPLLALLAVNLTCLAMNVGRTGSFAFIWVGPAILLLYVFSPKSSFSPSPVLPLSPSSSRPVPV